MYADHPYSLSISLLSRQKALRPFFRQDFPLSLLKWSVYRAPDNLSLSLSSGNWRTSAHVFSQHDDDVYIDNEFLCFEQAGQLCALNRRANRAYIAAV